MIFLETILTNSMNIAIKGYMLNSLISYFFLKITYQVTVNGVVGKHFSSAYSTPQGTVLGPLIFITFINDMFSLPLVGNLTGFVDTSIIYATTSKGEARKTWKIT